MLVDAEVSGDAYGRVLCKNCGTGVALFVGIAPEALVAGEAETDLPLLELRLLKAEEIGVEGKKNIFKALFQNGTQTVYVP